MACAALALLTSSILKRQVQALPTHLPDEQALPGVLGLKLCSSLPNGKNGQVTTLAAQLHVHGTCLFVTLKIPPGYPSLPPDVRVKGRLPHINLQANNGDARGYFALSSIWRCNAEEGWSSAYGLPQCLLHVQQFLSVFMTESDLSAMASCTDLEDDMWSSYPSLDSLLSLLGSIVPSPPLTPPSTPPQTVPFSPPLAPPLAPYSKALTDLGHGSPSDGSGWKQVGRHSKVTGGSDVPTPSAPPHSAASAPPSPAAAGGSQAPQQGAALLDVLFGVLQPLGGLLEGSDVAVLKHACGERAVPDVQVEAEFRCWYTGLTCREDTICVPLSYTRNPMTGKVDYILPCLDGYISMTAFNAGVRVSPSGTAFTYALPLFIDAAHYARGTERLLTELCRSLATPRIDMFCTLFSTCGVLLADGGIRALGRCLQVLLLVLHLCDKACAAAAAAAIEGHVLAFVSDPQTRTKKGTPGLGLFVALLVLLSRKQRYTLLPYLGRKSVAPALMMESFVRNVLWVCKNKPAVMPMLKGGGSAGAEADQALFNASFEGAKNSMRIFSIFATLESVILADGGSHASFVQQLDASCGMPSEVDIRRFRSGVLSARAMSSWPPALACLGLNGMDEAGIARLMRSACKKSLSLGYHAADTDFSAIHRSGVSKLLLKGESFAGLGPNANHIEVLDSWKWRGGRTQYLDATLLSVDACGEVVDYMDYAKQSMSARSMYGRGQDIQAGSHSGDQMGPQSGQHTMQVWMSAFPPDVVALYITASAFSGARLSDIVQPHVSVRDPKSGIELCRYVFEDVTRAQLQTSQAVVLCSFTRRQGTTAWDVNAIGKMCMGSADTDYVGIKQCIKALVKPVRI